MLGRQECGRYTSPHFRLVFVLRGITSPKTFFAVNVLQATARNSSGSGGVPMNSHFWRWQEWIKSSGSFPRKAFAAVDEHHRIWANVSARMQAFRDKMERR